MSKVRVAVLMGGHSNERDVSLSTGRQIMAALTRDQYTIEGIDTGADPQDIRWIERLIETRPDVAFIALHGRGGEDGTLQGMLEQMGIRYTGSGVLASALAMDKDKTKRLLVGEGVPVPSGIVLSRDAPEDARNRAIMVDEQAGFPCIVKPVHEGSAIGCAIVRNEGELSAAIDAVFALDTHALIETYLRGTEITVGILGTETPQILPIIEIVPRGRFYDYDSKYAPGGSEHIIPARISRNASDLAAKYAEQAHALLGCRGMSRVDMIVEGDQPWFLEINTIPGMTPTSLLPDAARSAGIPFPKLLDRIIEDALRGAPG